MPRKITTVTWECTLCDDEHATKREALSCERRGIVRPLYRMGQPVKMYIARSEEPRPGTVCQIWTDYLYPHLHDGNIIYIVCLSERLGDGHLHPADAEHLEPVRGPAPEGRNVKNWDEFWKMFGRSDKAARRAVRRYLTERKVPLRQLNGIGAEPRFR